MYMMLDCIRNALYFQFELFAYGSTTDAGEKPKPFSDYSPLKLDKCGKNSMCLYYLTPSLPFG